MTSSTPSRRRHSPAVYRRRRLVVLVAIVAIIAVVWLLIAQPWSGAASQSPQAEPAASPSPTQTELSLPVPVGQTPQPTPSATPAATTPAPMPTGTEPTTPACANDDLLVEPLIDKESYGSGEKPQLSIALTNTGDVDCTLNVGTSTQKFTVSSGSDVWWRSTDCQSKPSDQVVLLAAGQRVTSAAPLEWDRTRSSVKTCEGERPAAPGGGASYHLTVEIAGVESDGSEQFLLY